MLHALQKLRALYILRFLGSVVNFTETEEHPGSGGADIAFGIGQWGKDDLTETASI